jgi:hypothetical protein
MKNYIVYLLIFVMMTTLSGCEAIADIFSAGFYTGIFVVVLIVAIVIWLIAKMGRRK